MLERRRLSPGGRAAGQGHVVDQPGRADARRDRQQRRPLQASTGSSVSGSHERQVLGLDVERAHRLARRSTSASAERSPSETAAAAAASALGSASARARSSRLKMGVAARHRQPVGLAHRRTRLDAHRHVQVLDQAADHDHLLSVLLAEVGDIGRDHVQELRHDGRDAAEMGCAAHGALQAIGQAKHLDGGGEAGRIDLLGGGREQQVGPSRCGQLAVALLLAWIAVEVGVLVELRGVHEQRHDHHVALGTRPRDQRE